MQNTYKRKDVMLINPGRKARCFFSVGDQEDNFLNSSLADYSIAPLASLVQWLLLFFYPLNFG